MTMVCVVLGMEVLWYTNTANIFRAVGRIEPSDIFAIEPEGQSDEFLERSRCKVHVNRRAPIIQIRWRGTKIYVENVPVKDTVTVPGPKI